PLDHATCCRQSECVGLVGHCHLAVEMIRLDNQSLPIPVPSRVTKPQVDALRKRGAATERNDACVVDHFDEDDNVIWCLEDLVVVIVEPRHHCAWHTARNAALV